MQKLILAAVSLLLLTAEVSVGLTSRSSPSVLKITYRGGIVYIQTKYEPCNILVSISMWGPSEI